MTNIIGKLAILALIGTCATTAFAGQAVAQKSDSDSTSTQPTRAIGAAESGAPAEPPAAPTPQKATADPDDGWHFSVTPYLWFAGMHGSVGARGHEASVHAGFGEIFTYLNIGLMVGAEARYKKFGAPVDFL